jgi:uncharacterized protein
LKRIVAVGAGLFILIGFLHWQNNSIMKTEMTLRYEKLPAEFDGYKIIQLSDLHSKSFDPDQKAVSDKVRKAEPDIIFFTGDLVDSEDYDEKASLKLMEQLNLIAPVVFVTGNHEWWSERYSALEEQLIDNGITVLRNGNLELKRGNEKVTILGIDDPATGTSIEDNLNSAFKGTSDGFNILLAHRPELFPEYQKFPIDLIFSGHAHGGQFRLPLVGGMVAPNQGFLPRYDAGVFQAEGSTLIVNRGLGNSIIPQRLFNRPEIIEVTLNSK